MGLVRIGDDGDEYFYPSKLTTNDDLKTLGSFYSEAKPFGSKLGLKKTLQLSAALSGGTSNVGTNIITAGMFVLGVVIRVTTLITGCTSMKIGDGTDDDIWGATIALAAGTTTTSANFTAAPKIYTGNTNIVLTAVGGGASFSAGVVRACVHYIDVSALNG